MTPDQHGIDDVLTAELLERVRGRAAEYDETNTFCAQDLEELAAHGYLAAVVPEASGGLGWDLPTLVAAQRRLAAHAPATALAVNMHHVWACVARSMSTTGHHDFDHVLEEMADGEIYAFGISEPGNDTVLFDSLTSAEPQTDGSIRFTGTKIFTTLSPAWTRLGLLGKVREAAPSPDDAATDPHLVVGFLPRSAPGWRSLEDWDMTGMRATASHTTVLEGAAVPAERVVRRLPVGPNQDPLVFAIFSSFLTTIAAVYTGIADRAIELAAQELERRTGLSSGEPFSTDPQWRDRLAEAELQRLALDAQLRGLAQDIEAGVDHGASWFARLVTLRTTATRTAEQMVGTARQASGGAGYRRTSEISRLARDVHAGVHHPSSEDSARRTVARHVLGPMP